MKFLIFLTVIFSFLASISFAQSASDDYQKYLRPAQPVLPSVHTIKIPRESAGFFFKPFLSIEYSAPRILGGGTNVEFKTSHNLFSQVRDIENIALGMNLRIHRYLGFNANWAQTELDNTSLQNIGTLSREANFRLDQYNFSALFYAPIVENLFELFAEGGISDMSSRLNYASSSGNFSDRKSHETMGIYGIGFQILPSETSAIRFSVQKYSGKLALLNSHYETIRIGYLKAF